MRVRVRVRVSAAHSARTPASRQLGSWLGVRVRVRVRG